MKGKNKGQMSFGEIRDMVCMAVCAKEGADYSCYIVEMFSDSVVYESQGKDGMSKCYQRSYAIADGEVTLGEAVEVEKQVEYVPIKAAAEIMAAAGADSSGSVWRVRVIGWGPDKQGRIDWQREPLVAALPLFDGAKVFALNDSQHMDPAKAKKFGKSSREMVGALSQPEVCPDGIYASLVILPSAAWLQADLKACEARNIPYVYGLSVDVGATTRESVVAGKRMIAPVKIGSVQVDVVYDPVGKGEFLQQLAAARQSQEEENEMKREQLVAALRSKRPDVYAAHQAGIDSGTITDEQILDLLAADPTDLAARIQAAVATAVEPLNRETQLQASRIMVTTVLAASKLPESTQAKLKKRFADQLVDEATLQAAIQAEKEDIDALTASGRVIAVGDVRVGYESGDKLQAAFDQMLGVRVADDLRGIRPFTSLRAAYVEMTGDTDVTGVITPENARRLQAAYGDASFAYVLGNTLYRRVAQDYREYSDYGVSIVVGSNIRNARDFRKLETIRIGYYSDLPTVDTDTQDYPDLGEVSDEQVEYALAERGGIITIKRRTIINDDLRVVERIVSRLGRGARRGLARVVWNPFINNATYKGDNKAIFHADHGNLGSTAYGVTSALAAKTAMFQQTEPNSGERLGLRPVCVCFPAELFGIVSNVNNFTPQAVAVENGNSMYGFFKPEGLHQNIFMTDANDWMMFADPNEVEIVELAFLNGQQEPQMFIANNPTQGQMFLNGGLQYKITHDYNAEVVDYRGAYKAVVA
ncbi:hypothetical protein [Geobacter sp.]|uniref:phage major capsid protein n=1 Tax=Geobacter sp. TaxID=46610 RepID=UPI002627D2B7|nr:hypothetical protein [Geobacter sp.]